MTRHVLVLICLDVNTRIEDCLDAYTVRASFSLPNLCIGVQNLETSMFRYILFLFFSQQTPLCACM